jgi:HAE1 family hydrophobic/amphiphilic exporter-1
LTLALLLWPLASGAAERALGLDEALSLIGVVVALWITRGTLNLMSFIGIIMLMGLVAKNAILLLDSARKEEAKGFDRVEALMHAGRVRLRPILMTTFALIAGMMPVAIGVGEGGEFYRPMAVAIIGGTITSTLLTLLVVPTFYDSIEIARERAFAKFRRRAQRWNPFFAFVATLLEAFLTLILVRFFYRGLMKLLFRRRAKRTPPPAPRAAEEMPLQPGD